MLTIAYPPNVTTSLTEQLTFTARDRVGWTAAATARFSVSPNRPPVVSLIPAQTVTAPYAFAPILLDNYVADPDEPDALLTWTVTGNVRATVNISNRVAFITYGSSPTNQFTELLTFRATDPNGLSGSNTMTLTVLSNHPPVVSLIPTQSVAAPYSFAPILLDNFVADPDEPDSQITWTVTGNVRLTVNISNRVAFITYGSSPTNSIIEQLTFRATDPVGLTGSTTTAFIVMSNHPPVLTSIPTQSVAAPYSFASIPLDD